MTGDVVDQAAEIADIAEAKYAIEKAGGTWHEEGCLKMIAFLFLPLILLALVGCGDDFFDGGGPTDAAEPAGDYQAYWDTIETISAKGYIGDDMTDTSDLIFTQKPESPAPGPDQKGCPESWVPLLLVLLVYVVHRANFMQRTCLAT